MYIPSSEDDATPWMTFSCDGHVPTTVKERQCALTTLIRTALRARTKEIKQCTGAEIVTTFFFFFSNSQESVLNKTLTPRKRKKACLMLNFGQLSVITDPQRACESAEGLNRECDGGLEAGVRTKT